MNLLSQSACCVCGASDARALVEVALQGLGKATLCGSHAVIYQRAGVTALNEAELRRTLAERRGRRDRRQDGDELGARLTEAFSSARRAGERRGGVS
jgi:hypothetical protein